ncbi:hypothetical protein ACHAXT_007863 [Thalassiosira profunda]
MIVAPLLLAPVFVAVAGFSPTHQTTSLSGIRGRLGAHQHQDEGEEGDRVLVVGKLILDKYGDPSLQRDDGKITIGGGGPQSAWGACAALAVRNVLQWKGDTWQAIDEETRDELPPKQNVSFLAPVGTKNWTPDMTDSLKSLLPMLHEPPMLVPSDEHITPTINIWHDENEVVNWMPVDGSFGEEGADGLWRNRPCAEDILRVVDGYDGDVVLHALLESGSNPAGEGLDAEPFFDEDLICRISAAGIEPIVFPDEETGVVSREDIIPVGSLIERVEASLSAAWRQSVGRGKMLLISPDRACYDALLRETDITHSKEIEFAVRDGANGSFVDRMTIPAAKLNTPDGAPINPTGAGNAYAGAYVACRSTGSTAEEAATLANAVGGAVCECENLPPWTWEVLERIAEAACEISAVRSSTR